MKADTDFLQPAYPAPHSAHSGMEKLSITHISSVGTSSCRPFFTLPSIEAATAADDTLESSRASLLVFEGSTKLIHYKTADSDLFLCSLFKYCSSTRHCWILRFFFSSLSRQFCSKLFVKVLWELSWWSSSTLCLYSAHLSPNRLPVLAKLTS